MGNEDVRMAGTLVSCVRWGTHQGANSDRFSIFGRQPFDPMGSTR